MDDSIARQPAAGVIYELHQPDGTLLDRVTLTANLFVVFEGVSGLRVAELGTVADLLIVWARRCIDPEPGLTVGPVGLRMAENLIRHLPGTSA